MYSALDEAIHTHDINYEITGPDRERFDALVVAALESYRQQGHSIRGSLQD